MSNGSKKGCGCGTNSSGKPMYLDEVPPDQFRRRMGELAGGAFTSSGVTALPGFTGTGDFINGSARTFGDILFRLPDGETFRLG